MAGKKNRVPSFVTGKIALLICAFMYCSLVGRVFITL